MKYIRLSLATASLTLALALPAFAGEMQCPYNVAGQMDTPRTVATTGEMGTGIASTVNTSSEFALINSVTDVALNLAQTLLSLC